MKKQIIVAQSRDSAVRTTEILDFACSQSITPEFRIHPIRWVEFWILTSEAQIRDNPKESSPLQNLENTISYSMNSEFWATLVSQILLRTASLGATHPTRETQENTIAILPISTLTRSIQ
jgi:hypothetical protein